MANRLENSASAYLRSAAHQPIDWYEFGDEAFAKAKELDKPILLDIGAVWCHWCHVIDRESYDDPEIAQLINEHFIAIKVDRDQRPDVDSRYQQVVVSLTGHGGWPLTGFLTWDGRVIYGGTYFPPQTMKSLLVKISTMYREKHGEIFKEGSGLGQVRETVEQITLEEKPVEPMLIDNILETAVDHYDPENGGFGHQPKFPHFSVLELMIAKAHQLGDKKLRTMVEHTLLKMACGGIYDQIAGGFHRYSVDARWHVPHFEKMAYDNAEALKVYAQGYRLTENPRFKGIAEGIVDWVMRDLSHSEQGGFYASQDADINLEDDGDHFTWTIDELKELLTPQEQELVIYYYGVTPSGDMHERPGRNVLMVQKPLDEVATHFNLSLEDAAGKLESACAKMLEQRGKREIPFIDDSIYTNWNGMMIVAFLEAADMLDLPEARDFALMSLDRIIDEYYGDSGLLHTTGVVGMLEDYSYLIQALLKAYQSSGENRYLELAETLVTEAIDKFWDAEVGGFFDIQELDNPIGLLKFRRKPLDDNPSSSANGVMLQALVALFLLTENTNYQDKANASIQFFLNQASRLTFYHSAFALGVHFLLSPPLKLELTGNLTKPDHHGLKLQSQAYFYPGKLLKYSPDDSVTEVRACVGTHCLTPFSDPEGFGQLEKQLVGTEH